MAPRSRSIDAPAKAAPKVVESFSEPLLKAGADADAARHYVPKDLRKHDVPYVGQAYTGFLGDHLASEPLLKRLNWLHVPLLVITPVLGAYGVLTTRFDWRTYVFAVVYYFFSGLGITAGYHRLFAHRSYKATPFMRVVLALMGTAAVEGSVRWWARDHRAHHKYVDTPKDPYAAIKGFWYAHIGWMLCKQDKSRIGRADISDLDADPFLRWQHRNYLALAVLMGVLVPTAVCGLLWGDWRGGYFVAGVARLVFVHHSTFCVNSLAHWAGTATYTDGHTARNSIVTALVTLGEGYHNFHHEFPTDYRNGVEWWQYDPTKVFIWLCSLAGLTYDLSTFPQNEVDKGALQMRQKALEAAKARINWGPDPDALRVLSRAEFDAAVKAGAQWVICDGFVLDCARWAADHPGGAGLIRSRLGADISEEFRGGFYKHSNAGHNVASTLRVARIEGYWAK